jgi:hypothetical protein
MSSRKQHDARPSANARHSFLDCPTCGLPTEIIDRFTLDGAPMPVEHVKLVCVRGHWYTIPIDQLRRSGTVPDQPGTSPITQRR